MVSPASAGRWLLGALPSVMRTQLAVDMQVQPSPRLPKMGIIAVEDAASTVPVGALVQPGSSMASLRCACSLVARRETEAAVISVPTGFPRECVTLASAVLPGYCWAGESANSRPRRANAAALDIESPFWTLNEPALRVRSASAPRVTAIPNRSVGVLDGH
jgi:hypothetical protein